MKNPLSDHLIELLRETITALVRREDPDLSARQLAVLLTCYLESEAQTVRGLAAKLHVSKPAITRALDRLTEFELVRRKIDPQDRRSVLVQRTVRGNAFMRDLARTVNELAASWAAPSPRETEARQPELAHA